MLFSEAFSPGSAKPDPKGENDFPGSLYENPVPPTDQEAIEQVNAGLEAAQAGPLPSAEEVIDETEGEALRDIESEEAKRAEEAGKELYPDVDSNQ